MRNLNLLNQSACLSSATMLHLTGSATALALGMGATGALAQETQETVDGEAAIEVAAVSGQEIEGQTLGNFIPVVIGGDGDLLFVNQGALRDAFLTFDTTLDVINGASPSGFLNASFANYSIDATSDRYVVLGGSGIATGNVGDDSAVAIAFANTDANADFASDSDLGNLLSGASPLILDGISAILVTDANSSDLSNPTNFVQQDVLFVTDARGEFVQPPALQFVPGTGDIQSITSLSFAGANALLISQTPEVASANSALLSSLQRIDLSGTTVTGGVQVGPLGSPQPGPDFLRGGQGTFAGFTFNGTVGADGLTAFGNGVRFAQGEFSANSQSTAFVLTNALAGLDGSTNPEVPATLLVLDDQVIAIGSTLRGLTTDTAAGAVNFVTFEDVMLSETGEVFFRSTARLSDGSTLDDVSLWKITNPGEDNQSIAPVLTIGDQIRLPQFIADDLFPEGNGQAFVTITGFVSPRQQQIGAITRDGRPRFYSVNAAGNLATVVQISTPNGDADAIVAQDEDGVFQLVTFVGQGIELSDGERRTVSSFTAQFGSNDVDGAGDVYNADEQLGFIVSFSDFSSAVLRVSLNGREVIQINEFLWDGACGDDEFFTQCPDSNWVNNADQDQRAPAAPGVEPGAARAIIRDANVRIATADVTIDSIDSNSEILIENDHTLTLSAASRIVDLSIAQGAVVSAQTLETERLSITGPASAGNISTSFLNVAADLEVTDNIDVSIDAVWSGGNISGDGVIAVTPDELDTVPRLAISGRGGRLSTEISVEAGEVAFENGSNISIESAGRLRLSGQTTSTLRDGSITGTGEFVLEEGSSFTANGQVLIAPDLIVRDATMATSANTTVLTVSNDSLLAVDNLTFTRSTPGAIADETFADIVIGERGELVLSEDHIMRVDDRVRATGPGSFQIDGALSLANRGIFQNDTTFQIESNAISGDGLFINSGDLMLMTPTGESESKIFIDVPFALIGDGTVNIESGFSLDFNTDVVDAITSPIDLRQFGLDQLGVNLGANIEDLPDVSVLFAPASGDSETRNPTFADSVVVKGTGAVFFAGDFLIGDGNNFFVDSNVILTGSFTGDRSPGTSFFQAPDEFSPIDIAVIDTLGAVDFSTTVGTLITNANVFGASAATPPEAVNDANGPTSLATIETKAGRFFVEQGFTSITSSFIGALTISKIDDRLDAQFVATGSSFSDIVIINEGIMDLRMPTFEEGTTTRITNSGAARLLQPQIDGELELTVQGSSRAGLELSGALDGDQRIAKVTQTGGLLNLAATGGTITIGEFEQSFSSEVSLGPRDTAIVGTGVKVVVEDSNLLLDGASFDEAELTGILIVSGEIDFLRNGEAPRITTIAPGADIEILKDARIGSISENGFGLRLIEGSFSGAGRFEGDELTVATDDGDAAFGRGIETTTLTIEEGAKAGAAFTPENPMDMRATLSAQTVDLSGTLEIGNGFSNIETLNINLGGNARFQGDLTTTTTIVDGSLRVVADNSAPGGGPEGDFADFTATTLTLSEGSNARLQNANIQTLTVEERSELTILNGNLSFRRATVDGEMRIDAFADEVDVIRELTINQTGRVTNDNGGTLTKINLAEGGRFENGGPLFITDPSSTTIDGTFLARGNVSFAGEVRIGREGRFSGKDTRGAILSVVGLFSEGAVSANQIRVTGNNDVTITRRAAPIFGFSSPDFGEENVELELVSLSDMRAGSLFLANSNLINTGAIVVDGELARPGDNLVIGRSFAQPGYQGSADSYISITGNAQVTGGLSLGQGGAWSQVGNLRSNGLYRGSTSSIFFIKGSTNIRAAPPAPTAGIAPNRTLARVLSSQKVVAEVGDEEARHEIEGMFIVSEDAEFDSEVWVSEEGFLRVGRDLSFERADIDGTLFTGGTLTADVFDLSGSAQFGSGVFGSLSISQTGQLIGDDFSLTGDFTNLGTFVLGSLDDGPGQFSVGGEFINAGVFSGTGIINGSVVQSVRDGGPDASGVLFSPGFSPGVLDIAGDANFNEGMIFMEIGGLTPGTEHDQINVEGVLTFGSDAMLVVDLLPTESGDPFLLGTGDEVILFTAADISPDDVEQINFTVLDELPRGFALVADITTSGDGELLRVLRGFSGSTLADLSGLNISQAGVAAAIDFLSTSESGVPSQELFDLALELQFADTFAIQSQALTELGATTLSALQSTALRAGRYNMDFMTNRLAAGALMPSGEPPRQTSAAGTPMREPMGGSDARGQAFTQRDFARIATNQIQRSGGVSYFVGDGARLSLVGAAAVHFGDQDSRGGTIGFDQDGWSASLGAEYQNAAGSFLVGGAATLGESDADLDGGLGEASSQSTGFGLYTAYDAGVVRIGAAISAADVDLESLRSVRGLNTSGESDGDLLALHAQIYAPIVSNDAVKFGPKVAFDFQDLEINALIEAGAGDFSLKLPDMDRKVSAFTLGAAGDFGFDLGKWDGAISVDLGYQKTTAGDDFIAREVAFSSAPGTRFAAGLRPLVNDGVRMRSGLSLFSGSGLEVSAIYDGLFGQNGQSQNTVQAQVSVRF